MTAKVYQSLIDAFHQAGQGQVFRYFDELDPDAQARLIAQAEGIDLVELNALVRKYVLGSSHHQVDLSGLEPAPYISLPENGEDAAQWRAAAEAGEVAIRAGRVAAFCVAGGQGTRLGHDGPKGTFPVTPVTGKSLFQVFAEKIRRSGQRYGTTLHWFLLTSEINHSATVAHFEANDYFGLSRDSVHFIVQGLMPAVDLQGKLLLSAKDTIVRTPDGHGGALRALVRSGAAAEMKTLGIDCVSYFQVDNPLIRVIDPVFIGFHLLGHSELSSRMVPKSSALEKVGHFCSQNGRSIVVEYSDMPATMQEEKDASGQLRYLAGSVAIHLLDRAFIERVGSDVSDEALPFHRADKKIPHLDAEGNKVTPEAPNGIKFEMFVFDALLRAKNPVIIESKREDHFSPVKNARGEDSPDTCVADQRRMFGHWLALAGVNVVTDATGLPEMRFEISPGFAVDEADFLSRWNALEPKPALRDGLVIE